MTSRDFLEESRPGRGREAAGGAGLAAARAGSGGPAGGQRGPPRPAPRGKIPADTGPALPRLCGGRQKPRHRGDPALEAQGRTEPHVPGRGLAPGSRGCGISATASQRVGRFHLSGKGGSFSFSLSGRLQSGGQGRWCGLPRLRGEDCVPLLIKRSPRKMVSDMR